MAAINENIRFIRKQLKLTQDQFGQQLGIKRSLVGAYEEGRAEPRLELLHKMAGMAGLPVDALISTDLNKSDAPALEKKDFSRGKEVLVVSIDSNKRDNIELVPQKAAAGYMNAIISLFK